MSAAFFSAFGSVASGKQCAIASRIILSVL